MAIQEVTSGVIVRPARAEEAACCGQICFDAFATINRHHGFPCDFPGPELTVHVLSMMFSHPRFHCVVAEWEGHVVGSNCLDERSAIAGVGPITVSPKMQNNGVGHRLMQAVVDRAHQQHAPGVRLVQAAFHNRSLALYTQLGFDVREPLACMQGRTRQRSVPGCTVRPARSEDIPACNALCVAVHGFQRGHELEDCIQQGVARVVERDGRITGYSSWLAFFGHSMAETLLDLQALLVSAESFGGPGILVPKRNSTLFRWCLEQGLWIVQPLTLMSMGLYNDPAGAWLPSISF